MRSNSEEEPLLGARLDDEESETEETGDEWDEKFEEGEPTVRKSVSDEDGDDFPALLEDWRELEEYA